MYDVIVNLIGYSGSTSINNYYQYIVYGCIAIVCIFVAVFTDLIFRVFRHFWRR